MGLAVEFSLWATAAWLIWGLQMPIRKRLSILAILAIRFVYVWFRFDYHVEKLTISPRLVPFVALRLLYLSPSQNPDPSSPRLIAGIFTEIVMNLAFILSSLTCAKPFLKPFHSGYFIGASNQKVFGNARSTASSNANSYRMLDATASKSTNNRSIPQDERSGSNAHQSGDRNHFRPEPVLHHTTVSAKAAKHQHAGSDHMAISETKTWAVSYEGLDEITQGRRE